MMPARWTDTPPPICGYYWWRPQEHMVPRAVYLWQSPHHPEDGDEDWHWVGMDVQTVDPVGNNGWWWPIPLMMPPFEGGVASGAERMTPARWQELNDRWHGGGKIRYDEIGELLNALLALDSSLATGY